MAFKRLTAAQQRALGYLKALGEVVVSPDDARPLKALYRRGLVRYSTVKGIRIARYRNPVAEQAERRRLRRFKRWDFWPGAEKGV